MASKQKSHQKSHKKSSKNIIPYIISTLVVIFLGLGAYFLIQNASTADYIVETNAFFPPFEYYKNQEISGVDVEIVNRVAGKLGKKIVLKDVEFDIIIDAVAEGKLADAGAAGLTITPARSAKVDFSIPYYNSVQYVIFDKNSAPENNGSYVLWTALSGATLASQTGSTGYLFTQSEVEEGLLKDTNTSIKGFDTHQLSADAVSSHIVDYAIADELPAKLIVSKNPNLSALPIYYPGENGEADYPAEESYAIAVNKKHPELLEAFNSVLTEMMTKDESGVSELDSLILKHMGF